ncbi:hypothetical protein FHS16_006059 [Paenibacillus endophyticus]|uniref:Uncharacterized protein n=1 Tax=Paenibacillus endophyticus TaxID=1294268 RepID=A0A7W5CDZ2_9BACL|nr:hypothetical protein [Paenibacillus endophyticus]
MYRVRAWSSLTIFLILFGLAWAMDSHIHKQHTIQQEFSPIDKGYTIYSSLTRQPVVDPITPYGPREYVRIIRIQTLLDD